MNKYKQELLDAAREALAQQELEKRVEQTLNSRPKLCSHEEHFYCPEQELSQSVHAENWASATSRPNALWLSDLEEDTYTRH